MTGLDERVVGNIIKYGAVFAEVSPPLENQEDVDTS